MALRSVPAVLFAAVLTGLVTAADTAGDEAGTLQAPPEADVRPAEFAAWQTAAAAADEAGPYLNRLILEQSPYLRQHATNPVNWYRWSDDTLRLAESSKRLILLSIGYSTCHWCHVMNRESFQDASLAAQINSAFIAIKVDREESPLVDSYYSAILEAASGSAGWPLTAILLPDGSPVFIDAYLPPRDLAALLERTAEMYRRAPDRLRQSSTMLLSLAGPLAPAITPDSAPFSEREFRELIDRLMAAMDPDFGGLAGNQKFPQESLLLLLDYASRTHPDSGAAEALDVQLYGMSRGGIHDVVNGGFFRYATDSQWLRPHFEKMLYSQALLLRSYAQRAQITGDPNFLWMANSLREFVLEWLTDPNGYFYSSISADVGDREGAYYLWPDHRLGTLATEDAGDAGLGKVKEPDGHQGLRMSAPWSVAAARLRDELRAVQADDPRPFVDEKAIASWNAAFLSGLGALAMLDPPGAETTKGALGDLAEALWGHFNVDDQPSLVRLRYDNGDVIKGQLEDYAFMLLACIDLFDVSQDSRWLDRAEGLGEVIMEKFIAGGSLQAASQDSGHPVTAMRDTEIPAADSVAFEGLHRLTARRELPTLRRALPVMAAGIRERFRSAPLQNAYGGMVIAKFDLGEIAPTQYFAGGRGRAQLKSVRDAPPTATTDKVGQTGAQSMQLHIDLSPGWHINSDSPLQAYLIPTRARAGGWTARYPAPVTRSLSFDDEPLALLEGSFTINLDRHPEAPSTQHEARALLLTVQACSDTVCRAPEQLRFALPQETTSPRRSY